MKRLALFAACALAISIPAPAYYHFIHYVNGVAVPEKFDITALPNKTVTFFVSESGPVVYSQTDTFNSVLSQIRQATAVWNGIATSDMRVAFGGLENSSTAQNTPGGDVVFEDLPPGLYGYGGPTSTLKMVTPATLSPFFPVARSVVHLNRNLTVLPGPSFRESFFMTVVHEMGHALGLQHTFTSSTMSTATTRATTLNHPIDADDIAGVSVLYPAASFAQFGSITGRITNGSNGVHLASVVAIRAGWGAVSALSNPDGSFRIDGIPPGQYFVYAHTIPPDANINFPLDPDGSANPPSGPTNALFFPGTTNLQQAAPVSVQAGKLAAGINIALASRPGVEIYDVQIFGYLNNNTIAVQPAYVNMLQGNTAVSAVGVGLGSNGQAPGLNVQILGDSAFVLNNGVAPLQANGSTYIGLYLGFNAGAGTGPQHVVFTTPDYMHVLPAGIFVTQKSPPAVTAILSNSDGTLTVTGADWAADSLIYFDGLPATVASFDSLKGTAVVVPPPGANGQNATVTVYNSDGQNSQLIQAASPVIYSYGNSPAPVINSVNPSSLPAGAEAMVDITGNNFNFIPGLTTVGFGTTDIAVRRIFVLSPNHVVADVFVSPTAALSNPDVSAISGFQTATAPAAFQIAPQVKGTPNPVPLLQNALPGLTGIYAGAIVSLYGSNIAAPGFTPVVTFNGETASILFASSGQINLQIPSDLPPGPAIMNLNNGVSNSYPEAVNIDTPPSSIGAVQNMTGAYIDPSHAAHPGDVLIVDMNNFAPNGAMISLDRIQIAVGTTMHKAVDIASPIPGLYQVRFQLNADEQVGASQQLIVYLDGRSSYPASIPVAHADGSFTP
jgi:uncharacterized protein (TIGR03437 family)